MAKLTRITEPDEGPDMVHFGPVAHMDAVTLCGLTDFLGHSKPGAATRKKVTCGLCRAMVKAIQSADKEDI